MRGLFRSAAIQWSAIFLILSVVAHHKGQELWQQYRAAQGNLQAAQAKLSGLDSELAGMKRLIASVPNVDSAKSPPIHERLATLVQNLRKSEPETRVALQTIGPEGGGTDRRPVQQLVQPLPGLPEAGSATLIVEGTYLTRSGLEEFIASGRRAGASLTSLSVNERRFRAGLTLYGRI